MNARHPVFAALSAVFLVFTVSLYAQESAVDPTAAPPKAPPAAVEPGVALAEYYRDCVVWIETTMTVSFGINGYQEKRLAELGEFPMVHTSDGAFIFENDAEAVEFAQHLKENGQGVAMTTARYVGDSKVSTGGSGFFCDTEGGFYTVAHVVKEKNDELTTPFGKIRITAYEYWVSLTSKGRKYSAEIVGADVYRDLAYCRAKEVNPADYRVAKMGDAKKLRVGDTVYAFGAPYGLNETLTRGVVSGLNRVIELWYIEDFIQTDASIGPGSSGSPLLNAAGEVVGLNDAGIRGGGVNFAVSANLLNLDQLKKGNVELPWFGAEAMISNADRVGSADNAGVPDIIWLYEATKILDSKSIQELLRLTYDAGFKDSNGSYAIVTEVEKTKVNDRVCPAMRPIVGSGLKSGDLIVKVNGVLIRNGMDLRIAIVSMPLSQPCDVEYIRVEKGVITKSVCAVVLEKKEQEKR